MLEKKTAILERLKELFEGDYDLAVIWFVRVNNNFGISPNKMIEEGKAKEVEDLMTVMENGAFS